MAVKLFFFAQCENWVKKHNMELSLPVPKHVIDVLREFPELKPLLEHRNILKVVVNQEFAGFESEIKDGDEIAFLPPVSGG